MEAVNPMRGYQALKFLIIISLILTTAMVITTASCRFEQKQKGKVEVVVSILPLADFVENIGKEKVDVAVMVPPGASPHTYEPTPGQLRLVAEAKLFVKVGSGIEFELTWMDKIISTNKGMLVADASKGIELMGKDPHIWLSPRNARIMVENIYDGLVKIDPGSEAYYAENKNKYLANLDQLDKYISQSLAGITKRNFMVYHPAWGYFARDYNLVEIPIEEEGKEPSAGDIARLIEQAKMNNIKVIFVSPQYNMERAQVIAKEIGGEVVVADHLARDYIGNLHKFSDEISRYLK